MSATSAMFKPINPLAISSCQRRLPFAERCNTERNSNCGPPTKLSGASRVRRVLFEPVDHSETQKFLEEELKKHAIQETTRWEFDFKRGVPIRSPNSRFSWKMVPPTRETILMAPKRRRSSLSEEYDNSELYPQPDLVKRINFERPTEDDKVVPVVVAPVPVAKKEGCKKVATPIANVDTQVPIKKQAKITDFMQTTKKPTTTSTPKLVKKLAEATLTSPVPSKSHTLGS